MKRAENWRGIAVATWSGGIDSTGVVANLLASGYDVRAVTLLFGGEDYCKREKAARDALLPKLHEIAQANDAKLRHIEEGAEWLWTFSPDGKEIPNRNKRIMDFLLARYLQPSGFVNLGMGEYVGTDTWTVRDHVAGADCDHRALTSYLWNEYGPDYRLISLQDFGESRYKCDRLRLGINVLGIEGMALTTNCLHDKAVHCGRCYKCVERHAAFLHLLGRDPTVYTDSPDDDEAVLEAYLTQFQGKDVTLSWARWA